MTSPEEMSRITERMRAFCDDNQITYIVGVNHGITGSTLHIRMEDFVRVFSCRSVDVTTIGSFDHLRMDVVDFVAIALRPAPLTLGPRVEVMP